MDRFIRIQIYDSANEEVEYDNYVDENWGINAGSMLLDRVVMSDEIKFGELYANMFQVTIFGLPENVNLKDRKIVVIATYTTTTRNRLVNADNDAVVNEEGVAISTAPTETSTTETLFTGYINSSDTDIIKTDRVIVAYDRSYELRDTDISSWWNEVWANNTEVYIRDFRHWILNYVGLDHDIYTNWINDSIKLKNPFPDEVKSISFGTVLKAICELQCTCPNLRGDEFMEFVQIGEDTVSYTDISENLEGLTSTWKDFTTDTITGVGVYTTSEELAQVSGDPDNVYKLVGNMFCLSMDANTLSQTCWYMRTRLANIQYTPCTLNLVVSDFSHHLGERLYTPNGYAYIMQQTFSGSLLINETIVSPATNPTLSDKVDDVNDELMDALKFSKINHTIDEFSSEIYDPLTGESRIDQLSNKIVLKVATDGSIVQVDLGVDPDDQSASIFQVDADNISFISNNKIMLTANSLEIDSTNFSVDSAGNVTATNLIATGGTIGGWTISANDLHIGNYARLTKAGFTASNGGDTKYTTYGAEYITAGTNVPSTQSVLNLFNVTDNTTAIGKELSKIFDKKYIKAGTVVKTIAHANPVAVFTSTEINTLMNMTGASAGSVTVFVMNGDANAQAANVVMTYWQGSTVYAEFDTAPSAGSYRFNYIIVRF